MARKINIRQGPAVSGKGLATREKLRVMPPPNPIAGTLPRFKPKIVRNRMRYSRKGRGTHREPLA
jgi:hypothetical protein